MKTLYDSIITVSNPVEYDTVISLIRHGGSILIRDLDCKDFGLVKNSGKGNSQRLWDVFNRYTSNGPVSGFRVNRGDNISESAFLDQIKDHYPDCFEMFLFHPELLEPVK